MTRVGRNDPCPCGSGQKYKKCCLAKEGLRPGTTASAPKASLARAAAGPDAVEPADATAAVPLRGRALPGARRLVLAYPPYSTATAPPLGVCVLKAFVGRMLPSWSVKVLDLNLEAHQALFRGLRAGGDLSNLRSPDGPLSATALLRAAETFRGEHPEEFYGQQEEMVLHSWLWERAVPPATSTPAALRHAMQRNQPPPAWVDRQAELVLAAEPTVVGISIGYTRQLLAGLSLASAIARRAPVPIVFGGTLFNCGVSASWAAHHWPVDYIVTGSGERPLVAILSGEAERHPVPGVIHRHGGKLRGSPPRFENDLDAIDGPDFSDLDLGGYYSPEPVVPVMTSRGCYWRRCSFCTHYRAVGDTYQLRSIPAVVAELARHVAAGVKHFALMDDIISPARFSQLAQAIIDAGLDIRYYGMAKPVKQFDREALALIRRSGCRFVLWGLESGCQRVLDLMDKGTTVADIEQVLDVAAEVGIRNHVFVICGFPSETREEFQTTVDLLARHRASIVRVHKTKFVLERDTPIFDHPERFSITRYWPSTNPTLFRFETSQGMTSAEAHETLEQTKPFLRSFDSPLPQHSDCRSRDHLLLLYSHEDGAAEDKALAVADGREDERTSGQDAIRT